MRLGIILTATVKPAVVGGNFSVVERRKMYYDTLRFYAQTIGKEYPIYLVENSNEDLSEWETEFADTLDLTIMQFRPDDAVAFQGFDTTKGKGYNEYLMIAKAIDEIVQDPQRYPITHFLKITGRYPMSNIKAIIKEINNKVRRHNYLYIGDIKDTCVYELMGRKTLSSHWGDSRFFMANVDFYAQHMRDCYLEMNDYKEGCWAEHYFLNFSRQYRNDKRFCYRYRTQVRLAGVSGTVSSDGLADALKAQQSFKSVLHHSVRQVFRWIFPRIWF